MTHLGKSVTANTTRGFPQGGVLSPLLWNIVVDGLLKRLEANGVFVQGYADDLAILAIGKFEHTASELLSRALGIVDKWCAEAGLIVNPAKVVIVPFTRRRRLGGLVPLKIQGADIRFVKQVKYLGVILDHRLKWNKHIKHAIDRGKWALMSCRRMVGGSWGLKPKLMHWLYASMVRPSVLYGSTVWWPCVEVAHVVRKLAGFQRMACLSITGAVSSTPGAALNCCLDILPLEVCIMAAARSKAHQLQLGKLWHGDQGHGHTKITSVITGDGALDMVSDHMIKRYSFSRSFSTEIPSREEWKGGGSKYTSTDVVWFTDGSKTAEGTGAGIHGVRPCINSAIPMGRYPTVFQAEVLAVLECCRLSLRMGFEGRSITILTDSQSTVNALSSFEFSSRLVWECYMAISVLGRSNEVSLVWVPGHSGIDGNEAADALANQASASPFTGPQPFCGLSRCIAKRSILDWAKAEHTRRWKLVEGQRMSKMVLRSPSTQIAQTLLLMGRSNLRQVVGLVTGHGHWLKHLHRMGVFAGDPRCRKCGLQEETAEHLLFDCDALARSRFTIFGTLSRTNGIPQKDLAGNILDFLRLMDLPAW